MSVPFILISIAILIVVAVLVFFVSRNRSQNHITPLAGLAFGFIVAGILFGENRFIGYSFLGIGVIVAIIDIFASKKNS
jgi:hypothetical protein